jgi:hypothetical protein
MKTTVVADSEKSAKQQIFDKIIFHKVAESKPSIIEMLDELGSLFNQK